MHENLSFIPLLYLFIAIPFAVMGLYAWRRRPAVGVTAFAWMMVSMGLWSFAYSLEIFVPALLPKLILVDIEYLGIVSIPVFLLIFAFEYTGKRHLLTPFKKALLWFVPLLIVISTWTNEFHGWMWDSARVETAFELELLAVRPGPLFWLNIGYSYLLIFVGTLLLMMEFIQRPGVYRFQVSLVIIGLLSPWIGSIFYVFELSPVPNLDLTPLFFLPSSLALGWAITRYRLLDVIPLEHVAVLRNMRDAVIVLDAQNRILYLNPMAELLLGRSEGNAIGQPLNQVSPPSATALMPHLNGTEGQYEVTFNSEGNAPIYEVTISPMGLLSQREGEHGTNHVVILHDISLRKEAEALLTRRQAIMEAIGFAAEQFLKEALWEHTIPAVLAKMGRAFDVSRVYVAMNYVNEEGVLHSSLCYEWAAPGFSKRINDLRMLHMPLKKLGFDRWEECLGQGQTIQGSLKGFPEPEQIVLQPFQIVSLAVAPIFADRQWWGFIGIDECRGEREWSTVELEALNALANIFGSAETRTRSEQKLLRRQNTLNMLQGIVEEALQSSDLSSMAEKAVEQIGRLIKADGCFLSLWDESNKQTFPLAAFGRYKATYPKFQTKPGELTFTSAAMKTGKTLVVEDVASSAFTSMRMAKAFQVSAVLVLPMIAGINRLGSIIVGFDRPHRFLPEEISISEQASGLIALALEKFQAVEHARRRADEAERLRKAGAAITETLQAEEAVQRVLEQLAEVIPYDSASVQILDGNELVIVGGRGWDRLNDVIGMRFPIPGDNPNTKVIQTGRPYILHQASKDFPAFSKPPHDHIKSWMGVPLIVRDRIIGLLAIDSSQPNRFSKDKLHLVMAFAEQVAIALENARLFKESHTQAITDELTKLFNRRGLFELGEFEFARARRIGRPFAAIMLDIDHFKAVNDLHGHAAGDYVLRMLAERCRHGSRAVDLIGRYGGEEFILLLPETNLESARLIAERLRNAITKDEYNSDAGSLRITVSVGVAEMSEADTLKTLIDRADTALYQAKNAGRNRVAVAK
jgi:diguanylate cyclase (GGDEF)-like protein/PAS domain S-box-containing protein